MLRSAMAVVGDSRSGTKALVASLDDARKRRERRPPGANVAGSADEQSSVSDGGDCSGYALGLADSLMSNESEAPAAARADEVLARYESAIESDTSTAVFAPSEEAAADEILMALEAHHERAQPPAGRAAPRGSADLDADQPRPGMKAIRTRTARTLSSARRRLIAAAAVATGAVALIAVGTSSTATSSKVADRQSSASRNAPLLTLGTIALPKLTLLAVSHDRASAKPRVHTRPRHLAAHRAAVHSSAAPPVSVGPPSSSSTVASNSGSNGALPSGSVNSSHPSAESSSAAVSGTQPAGPAGPGSTVGGNCNPKCS